ncbi:hypothetical protein AB7M49_006090 [Bradyrhizobium elkanii]
MDVSELLAQKRRMREERNTAALDEPAFTLTEREFDHRLRRAFAERERSVATQVHKLLGEHMLEIDGKLAEIEEKIASKNGTRDDEALLDAVARFVVQVRKQLREEITAHRSNEFFYLDADGKQQDAELHGPILRAVDGPFIDEKIMGPIRARNRAKFVAEREAARRSRRHG